jgi:hypothetical protein
VADQRDDPESTWQPATSDPGELYTIEGQIRGVGAFASGLKSRAGRSRHKRPMARVAAVVLVLGALVVFVLALI